MLTYTETLPVIESLGALESLSTTANMAAELSTPSAANIATARQPTPSNASKEKNVPTSRPDRPDEEQYKAELAKAEKELKAAEDRMVCTRPDGGLSHIVLHIQQKKSTDTFVESHQKQNRPSQTQQQRLAVCATTARTTQ